MVILLSPGMDQIEEMVHVTISGSLNTGGNSFDPERDIPLLVGKAILITVAAGDLGQQMAVDLARRGNYSLDMGSLLVYLSRN